MAKAGRLTGINGLCFSRSYSFAVLTKKRNICLNEIKMNNAGGPVDVVM